MKYFSHLLAVFFILITLASCGTTQQLVSNIKPSQIDKILIIKPLARIDTIGFGNRAAYDKNLSKEVSENLANDIELLLPKRIQQIKPDFDSLEQFLFHH